MPRRIAVFALISAGCAAGAGPVVGFGERRGWFAGAEAGGGLVIAQVAAGALTTGDVYIRGDAILDHAGVVNGEPRVAPGGRLGGGAVPRREWQLVFAPRLEGHSSMCNH